MLYRKKLHRRHIFLKKLTPVLATGYVLGDAGHAPRTALNAGNVLHRLTWPDTDHGSRGRTPVDFAPASEVWVVYLEVVPLVPRATRKPTRWHSV